MLNTYKTAAPLSAMHSTATIVSSLRLAMVFALLTGASLVHAQTAPQKLQPIPEPPAMPANASSAQEDEPEVTIRERSGGEKAEEYRVRGKLYMVKVTPAHGKPYYLIDQRGDGVFTRMDGLDTGLKVPQWVIHSW